MKNIIKFINESGSSFSEQVKYSKSDWEKWKKEMLKEMLLGNYEDDTNLELIYITNHNDKKIDHIATYNTKTEILWCDDINLFGHEL